MTDALASSYMDTITNSELIVRVGKVEQFHGLVIEANGPDAFLGEICEIYTGPSSVKAEVVGFRDNRVQLVPFDNVRGVNIGSEVVATGKAASIAVGEHLIGRIIDAFGYPLDGGSFPKSLIEYPLYPEPINPLTRQVIDERFETGIKVIDVFTPVGKGQRMGVFAGSGVGKSTLLGSIASNVSGDINVFVLVGERGREVVEFVEQSLGKDRLKNSVVIVATADQHPLVRTHAAYAGTAIAEFFKDQGNDVLLAMDSVTRFAIAQRDIGLATGEPPSSRGFTPSTFSAIPKLIERAGNFSCGGSITAFYTVLVEGDDFNEPVSDNLRAILDGHIVLTRDKANRGVYPAVDINQSISRLFSSVVDEKQQVLVRRANRLIAIYEESKDLIELGGYTKGSNPELDVAIEFNKKLEIFISQKSDNCMTVDSSLSEFERLF
jgi:flagellum-specific ATP synthase